VRARVRVRACINVAVVQNGIVSEGTKQRRQKAAPIAIITDTGYDDREPEKQ